MNHDELAADLAGHLRGERVMVWTDLQLGPVRPATGPEFHQHCLQVLNELQGQHPGSPPVPRSYLYGCMYDRTNRCVHRFGPAAA